MRDLDFHRRAEKYLIRMPRDRQIQIVQSLEELATLDDPRDHPSVKALSGNHANWFRLRTGVYRSIFQIRKEGDAETLYIDFIGPRGDAY